MNQSFQMISSEHLDHKKEPVFVWCSGMNDFCSIFHNAPQFNPKFHCILLHECQNLLLLHRGYHSNKYLYIFISN